MKYYLGIDLGGTNIACGVVNENFEIVGTGKLETRCPRPAEEIVDDMAKASLMAVENANLTMDEIEWVGVGSPGIANRETGVIEFANNLQFYNVPMRDMLQSRLGKPVFIENDANAAAYGEAVAGAAKGMKDVLAITLGTGLGGGIIIDSKIYGGFHFAGAELGHAGMIYEGEPCSCGRKGCVEAYCSATALIRQTKEAMRKNPDSKMWEICGGDLERVNGKTAFDGMRAGDAAAQAVVDQYLKYLGYAVATFVNIFQPEILVIGGGICKEGETLLAPLRKIMETETYGRFSAKTTRLATAKLGNDAGIIGAAFLGNLA